MDQARKLVEQGEPLASIAFIGNIETEQVYSVLLDDGSDQGKDASTKAIGMTAEMLDADFIFQIREAWELPPEHVSKYERIIDKYGSIGDSPYAVDVAAFTLETTHGVWIAMMPFKAKPPSKKRRTFGPVLLEHAPHVEGRFVGLLPQKANESGTLH